MEFIHIYIYIYIHIILGVRYKVPLRKKEIPNYVLGLLPLPRHYIKNSFPRSWPKFFMVTQNRRMCREMNFIIGINNNILV
jgi:hypothetical protein